MELSQAIIKARSAADLNDIFVNHVNIQLGWINDEVTIEGYKGVVTTDFIAYHLLSLKESNTEDSQKLANFLAEKVFTPLKKLVESPENQCSFYQISALTRISWTPSQHTEFGEAIALKHAMVLGLLDRKYYWW